MRGIVTYHSNIKGSKSILYTAISVLGCLLHHIGGYFGFQKTFQIVVLNSLLQNLLQPRFLFQVPAYLKYITLNVSKPSSFTKSLPSLFFPISKYDIIIFLVEQPRNLGLILISLLSLAPYSQPVTKSIQFCLAYISQVHPLPFIPGATALSK